MSNKRRNLFVNVIEKVYDRLGATLGYLAFAACLMSGMIAITSLTPWLFAGLVAIIVYGCYVECIDR